MKTYKRYYLVGGAGVLLIVAVTLHIQQLFVMAAMVALLAPVSYLLSCRMLRGLKVRRQLPHRLTAGKVAEVKVTVHNVGSLRRTLFSVQEVLPAGLTAPAGNEHLIVDLGPDEQYAMTYELLPLRRGVYELSELRLITSDATGLFDFVRSATDSHELLVYPQVLTLPDLWPTRAATGHVPQTSKRMLGQGPDFYGVREYVPGDDLRRIHWKVTAHRGKLTVIERERAQNLAATVILDLSQNVHAGRGNESSLEYGVTLAASLLVQALRQDRFAGLIARGSTDYSVPLSRDPDQEIRLLEALAHVAADSPRPLPAVVNEKRQQLAQAGSVTVISPQIDERMSPLAAVLQEWGNGVSWFSLVAPSFEGQAGSEVRYQRFAATVRQRGCYTHLVRGGAGLAATMPRRQSVAS